MRKHKRYRPFAASLPHLWEGGSAPCRKAVPRQGSRRKAPPAHGLALLRLPKLGCPLFHIPLPAAGWAKQPPCAACLPQGREKGSHKRHCGRGKTERRRKETGMPQKLQACLKLDMQGIRRMQNRQRQAPTDENGTDDAKGMLGRLELAWYSFIGVLGTENTYFLQRRAIASISTRPPAGSAATCTQERAGKS